MIHYVTEREVKMKASQAAKALNRSYITIKRWIYAGKIKAVKVCGSWEIPDEEVERLKGGN
jgi:putative resolvase